MAVTFLMPAMVGHVNSSGFTVKWTDEGREGVEEDRDERSTLVTTAAGRNIKFIKAIKKKWTITYTMIPQNQYQTIDGFLGRDEIRNFIYTTNNGNSFTFVLDDGINPAEQYDAYVDNYQDTLQFRRPGGNRYNLTISLSEV